MEIEWMEKRKRLMNTDKEHRGLFWTMFITGTFAQLVMGMLGVLR
jgi:hypothetical protein